MVGVDSFQAMIFLGFLLFTAVHVQGASSEQEEYLLAGGNPEEEKNRISPSPSPTPSMGEEEDFMPVQSTVYGSSLALEAMMSHGELFETCSGCRCCSASNRGKCVNTRCCFAIKCNLPGKPFGVCSLSPLTCGCGPNNKCNSPPESSKSLTHLLV